MKYVNPLRLKVLMMMFFVTGVVGIIVGLKVAPPQVTLLITFMGVINISLGGFFGWIFLNQTPQSDNKRKKKRDNN